MVTYQISRENILGSSTKFMNQVLNVLFWCFDGGATPLPIPNREVKPASADDSLNGKSK